MIYFDIGNEDQRFGSKNIPRIAGIAKTFIMTHFHGTATITFVTKLHFIGRLTICGA